MPVTKDGRPIVETGAVIARFPFDGKWAPCVRREGQAFGSKVSPEFDSEAVASEFARKLQGAQLAPARKKGLKS